MTYRPGQKVFDCWGNNRRLCTLIRPSVFPSGRVAERQLLTKELAAENAEGIRKQLEHFLDFGARSNPARMVNNHDWLGGLAFVDFLRDIGKHFSVNQMLAKESVKRITVSPFSTP